MTFKRYHEHRRSQHEPHGEKKVDRDSKAQERPAGILQEIHGIPEVETPEQHYREESPGINAIRQCRAPEKLHAILYKIRMLDGAAAIFASLALW
jgi:hypothetical protein